MDPLDRVEAAFNKFDTDGNGYIDWEEFKQVIVTTLAVAVVISDYDNKSCVCHKLY